MKANAGERNGWRVALGGLILAVGTSGCSALIAHSGVRSVEEISKPETRAEVRAAFGEADEVRTSPEGRTVERRKIRRRVPWVCEGAAGATRGGRCEALGWAYVYTLGLADAFVIPVIAHRSEQAKLHYVFVYGADDRVLCRYDVAAAPLERFAVAIDPLADALSRQLKDDGCPSWERCLTVYAEEVRRRSVCVDYTLTSKQEAMLRQLRTVAADADAGRLPRNDALARIQWCAPLKPDMHSCVPPPSGEEATPASTPCN